ncbi:MAG: ABC transporter ATP-binding protein [Candidatus Sumerlaeota bacterium]
MAEQTKILSVREASKIYRMGEVEVVALDAASINVYENEMLVVVGPSGSGKSTLLNMIGGMDHPTKGDVVYYPKDGGELNLSEASAARLTKYRRTEIGFVFQFFNLVPTLTAKENILVTTEISSDPLDPMETLDMVGLAERANNFPSQLSGGEQQRVAIARALAGNPRLILCDEPTGALDTETSRELLKNLLHLKKELGKTIVVITHDVAIPQAADRKAVIHDGKISAVQTNENPADPETMEW